MSSNVKILVRFILSEPNSLITWDANYLPKKLDLNATTWLPFDVFNQSYRNFEQKFLRGRECQENCPTQISLQLPKITLDRVYLHDALLLLGKALGSLQLISVANCTSESQQVDPQAIACRKRNGRNAIWSSGSTVSRSLKQFDAAVRV